MPRETRHAPEAISQMQALKFEVEDLFKESQGFDGEQNIEDVPIGELIVLLRENTDASTRASIIERARMYLNDHYGTDESLDDMANAIIDILGNGEKGPDDKEIDMFSAMERAERFSAKAREAIAKHGNVLNIPQKELETLAKMAEEYIDELKGGRESLEGFAREIINASKTKK